MPDEMTNLQEDARGHDTPPQPEDRRTLWGALGVAAVLVIVILVLLLIPRCGSDPAGDGSGSGKTIESVQGFDPVEGLVSVWISAETDIGTALSAAGVSANGTIDTGDGRWVVQVTPGGEQAASAALKRTRGVYDAGLVYRQNADAGAPATTSP